MTLLDHNSQDNYIEAGAELRTNAQRLADTLRSFGVDATAGDVVRGPAITRYEFVLDQGVKLSKITNLADDIALALGAAVCGLPLFRKRSQWWVLRCPIRPYPRC